METTKLSSKGQVVLPKSVRDAGGWREGTEFVVEAVAGGVVLRAMKPFAPTSLDQVAGMLYHRGAAKSLEDFDLGIRAEVSRPQGRTSRRSR
jgi:AbrB family looped-hinge helix DNA binding protein